MNSTRKLWTGIAAITLALTVAEVAMVSVVARGAERWWRGEDGRALRRAGAIVGSMVTDRLDSGTSGRSLEVELADLNRALAPLAGATRVEVGSCRRCGLRHATLEARARARAIRQITRLEIREAVRRAHSQLL